MKLHNISKQPQTVAWKAKQGNKPLVISTHYYGTTRAPMSEWKAKVFPDVSWSELTKRALALYQELYPVSDTEVPND